VCELSARVLGACCDAVGAVAGRPPQVRHCLSPSHHDAARDTCVATASRCPPPPKGKKARDLRTWLTVYSYWNQVGRRAELPVMVCMGCRGGACVFRTYPRVARPSHTRQHAPACTPPSPTHPPTHPPNTITITNTITHAHAQGGLSNVINMFLFLTEQALEPAGLPAPPPPQETPQTGCLHPARPGQFWAGPAEYMAWCAACVGRDARLVPSQPCVCVCGGGGEGVHAAVARHTLPSRAATATACCPPPARHTPARTHAHACAADRYEREGPLRGTGAPVVGVLLYRKHVITDQPYIGQLIRCDGTVCVCVFRWPGCV
jgi:hypothetical protein